MSSSDSKGNPKKAISKLKIGYEHTGSYKPVSPDLNAPPQFTEGHKLPVRYVRCDYCGEEHPSFSETFCPKKLCTVCFTPGHFNRYCPFRHQIPRGASYDRVKYHVVCGCGVVYFDENKWFCPRCRWVPSPRLVVKFCSICETWEHHCTEECPKDKIAAAGFRAEKEYQLTHDMYPHFLKCPSPSEYDAAIRASREVHEEMARVVRAAKETETLLIRGEEMR